MDNQEFIKEILDGAIMSYKEFNVLPSLTLAQAILESDWGYSDIGNNLFGIKWTENCGFAKREVPTSEYINGKMIQVMAYFRIYKDRNESVIDHGNFLATNSRYQETLKSDTYITACRNIQKAGYATDPTYADKLIDIIERYNLNKWDGVEYKMDKQPLTKEEAKKIVQEKTGFTDATIQYMADDYRFGDALIIKLATVLQGGN